MKNKKKKELRRINRASRNVGISKQANMCIMEVPEGEEKYIQRNNVRNQLELEGWSAE